MKVLSPFVPLGCLLVSLLLASDSRLTAKAESSLLLRASAASAADGDWQSRDSEGTEKENCDQKGCFTSCVEAKVDYRAYPEEKDPHQKVEDDEGVPVVKANFSMCWNKKQTTSRVSVDVDFRGAAKPENKRFLPANCSFEYLTYHVHTKFIYAYEDSTVFCGGSEETGDHYDPGLACGPSSEYASTLCPALARHSSQYQCSGDYVKYQRNPEKCERGDLSGKAGKLVLKDLQASASFLDLNPPTYDAFNRRRYMSVVFHCPNGARAFCARLKDTPLEP